MILFGQDINTYRFTFLLTSNVDANKVLKSVEDNYQTTYTEDYFEVSGVSESKFYLLNNVIINDNQIPINEDILIESPNLYIKVLLNSNDRKIYKLFNKTNNNINNEVTYIDNQDGITKFNYRVYKTTEDINVTMVAIDGVIDEPKIDTEVFIDRGFNNINEKMNKLKNSYSVFELQRYENGLFNVKNKEN